MIWWSRCARRCTLTRKTEKRTTGMIPPPTTKRIPKERKRRNNNTTAEVVNRMVSPSTTRNHEPSSQPCTLHAIHGLLNDNMIRRIAFPLFRIFDHYYTYLLYLVVAFRKPRKKNKKKKNWKENETSQEKKMHTSVMWRLVRYHEHDYMKL